MIRPYRWCKDRLELLDQRRLPHVTHWIACTTGYEVADAIKQMVVRGAPAIGIAAAYGLVLEANYYLPKKPKIEQLIARLEEAADGLAAARPTAVNLIWAIDKMRRLWRSTADNMSPAELAGRLEQLAVKMDEEDLATNVSIGKHGAPLLAGVKAVLTHCNTGGLATSGYGTAVGVIKAAHQSQPLHVYVCETRPYWQGARLTTWELQQEGIPVTLIADSAAAFLMRTGKVQAVITGADRITRNGDVANKIGTYGLAISARTHGIPFYVAAPCSSIDLSLANGDAIEIEFRDGKELTHVGEQPVAPLGTDTWNPAFDITPAELITAVITEAGVARAPYNTSLEQIITSKDSDGNSGTPGGGTVAGSAFYQS